MESQFSIYNYSLMLISIISHYYLGKKIINSFFITNCMVGLVSSALIVAIFANVCAGAIKYYVIISISIGSIISIINLFKFIFSGNKIQNKSTYFYLIFIGLILIYVNNPTKIYLKENKKDQILLAFDGHLSSYSSRSSEMLNARYYHRLNVQSAFKNEYKTYHFFNSSTQAIVQGLIKHPGLFSFFIAELLIQIFILSSFFEIFHLKYKYSGFTVFIFFLWIYIGLTIFNHSLTWSLGVSQPFAVFSTVLLIANLFLGKFKECSIYSIILGASAIRFFPISFLSLFCILIYFYRNEFINISFNQLFLKFKYIFLLFILFLKYYFITFFYPSNISTLLENIEKYISKYNIDYNYGFISNKIFDNLYILYIFTFPLIIFLIIISFKLIKIIIGKFHNNQKNISNLYLFYSSGVFLVIYFSIFIINEINVTPYNLINPGWYCTLFVYKWIGYFEHFIIGCTDFLYYQSHFFSISSYSNFHNYFIILSFVIIVFLFIYKFSQLVKTNHYKSFINNNVIVYCVIIISFLACIFSKNIFSLFKISVIYIILGFLMVNIILNHWVKLNYSLRISIMKFILILLYGSSLLLLIKLPDDGILVPSSYIMFDVFIWGLFCVFLLTISYNRYHIITLIFIGIISIYSGPNFKLSAFDNDSLKFTINVTPIFSETFSRSNYVNSNNMFIFDHDKIDYIDAYSSIFGAHLFYNKKMKHMLRNNLIR